MTPRGERVRDLSDTLERGARFKAADSYIEAKQIAERITGASMPANSWHDFLAGWDAAMEVNTSELANENQRLHGMVIDLCHRLAVRRCDKCHGLGVDDQLEPCSCDGGWVDSPAGEAERIVKEVNERGS